jgi:hypothetical protein
MSRRDLAHVMAVLGERSGGAPGVGVAVADIDRAIGRGHGDMRTPLNLQSLRDDGRAEQLPDGSWALTPDGVAWVRSDQELSGR